MADASGIGRATLSQIEHGQPISLLISVPLALFSAYRSNSKADKAITAGAFGLISLPGFALRNYLDEFVPGIPGSPGVLPGPVPSSGGSFGVASAPAPDGRLRW